MKIILSPAKTFHKHRNLTDQMPIFKKDADLLMDQLKKVDPSHLQRSMKLSEKLTQDVMGMFHDFGNITSKAIYTYYGQVYKVFDVFSLSADDLAYAENHLLILSGLYGVLKPLDGISFYRLEMQDQTIVNLYTFWKIKINDYLKRFCLDDVLINLASEEYSKIIDPSMNMITIDFVQLHKGKLRRPSMHIKTMRGLFARYLILNRIQDIDELKHIVMDGYQYDEQKSAANHYVYIKEV